MPQTVISDHQNNPSEAINNQSITEFKKETPSTVSVGMVTRSKQIILEHSSNEKW